MQRSLISRLDALEAKQPTTETIDLIIRAMYAPGPNGPVHLAPKGYHTMRGDWRLDREPDEGDEAFQARALALVPRTPGQVVCLIEEPA